MSQLLLKFPPWKLERLPVCWGCSSCCLTEDFCVVPGFPDCFALLTETFSNAVVCGVCDDLTMLALIEI